MAGTFHTIALCVTLSVSLEVQMAHGQGQNGQPSPLPAHQDPVPAQGSITEPEVKPAPPTPIAQQKEELGKPGWDPEWDMVIEKALPSEMLTEKKVARDVKPFCPRYRFLSDADKRAFWAYFFQALAGSEAGLIPTITVRHTEPEVAVKDTVTKRMVRSEGLLQLAYMDADRYGCDFDWEKDKQLPAKDPAKTILQPENNLLCGVKILNNQIIVHHKPLVTRKSYWATLQPGTVSYKVFLKQMTNVPDVCRATPLNEARARGGAAPQEQASRASIGTLQ
jgi:hypothetical protein